MRNNVGNDRLFIINANGTGRREIILPLFGFQATLFPLSFSRDGSQLALFVFNGSRGSIAVVNTDDTDGTSFRIWIDNPVASTLSGDWTTLVGIHANGLVLAKTDGTAPIVLDSGPAFSVSVSYDASQIAYSRLLGSFPSQRLDVFVINGDGTSPRSIANTPEAVDANGNPVFSFLPSISQNGSVVTFFSSADLDLGKNTDLSTEVFVAQLRPSLSIDGAPVSTHRQGETFNFTGFGFTPNGPCTRRVRQPDGTEVTLNPPMTADANGRITWDFPTSTSTPTGTYQVWVIDEATGRISNTVYETIIP
jgi:hypothetical protein